MLILGALIGLARRDADADDWLLAEVLGIPPAFLYTDDDVLAELLLRWNVLTLRQKKNLLKQAETASPAKRSRKAE